MIDRNVLRQEALDYYVFLVEDRLGRSAEITKKQHSLEIRMHDEANLTVSQAHLFCINLTIATMESFNVFVPFKLFDSEGDLITLETYANFMEAEIIETDSPFIVDVDDEEEFYNFG